MNNDDNHFPQESYNSRPVDPHRAADAAEKCIRCRCRIADDDPCPHGLCDDCDYEDRMEAREWKLERKGGTEES